jgi:3D (Asp-Asp-Asp) domain-containing protein
MINKKDIIQFSLITSLLVNVTIGTRYIVDKKEYVQNLEDLKIHNLILDNERQKILQDSAEKDKKISNFSNKIDLLTVELDKVKKENQDLIKENNQIKKEYNERKEVKQVFDVTAYTAGYESTQKRKGDKGYGLTASGVYVKEGRTIACPPSMEFGTKVKIEGIGLRTCEDRGSAIKTGHLDLYMDSVNEALNFGRQKLTVEIINQRSES